MGEGRCIRCAREKCWLHHVKLQGKYQRLCSSCVMLCFGDLYCPYCLEDCGDLAGTIKCSKCPRNVHLQCESRRDNSSSSASSSSCFLCPHCLNPDFNPLSVFKINAKPNANAKAKGQGEGNSISKHMPDFVSAKLLLTAARISSVSIKRAAAAASIEASKRAREAAKLNKEAKEAVDKALAIAKEEEAKRKPPTATATATALPQPGRTEDKIDFGNFVTGSLTSVPLQTSTVASDPIGRTQ